jgi:hypothetical protein
MPNTNRTISVSVIGMNFDLAPMDFKEGMYAFGMNGVIEGSDGMGFPILQSELSNILGVNFPSGSTVVGFINVVEQNRIIWLLYNTITGGSEIGETQNPGETCRKYVRDGYLSCDDCASVNVAESAPLETIHQSGCTTYTTIQVDSCFNFSNKYPINAVEYRITPCSLQIFFADDNNPRRWMEFYYVNNDPTQALIIKPNFFQIIGYLNPPCDAPVYGPNLDCNAINVQPSFNPPCIVFDGLVGGGSLLAGDYQFFVSFSDVNGNKLSSYLSATNPIPISTRTVISQTNYNTGQAISLDIQGLNPSGSTQAFQYYNLAVAKTIDNFTSFYLVGTFPITQEFYTYTGNNAANEVALSTEQIFDLYVFYNTAGSIGQSNGVLFWGDLTENVKPNLQQVANNITLYWQTIAIPEEVYFNANNTVMFRGYMGDEVYPFGIQFVFNNGEESNAYHIPGRSANSTDLELIYNNDTVQENSCIECSGSTPAPQVTINPATLNLFNCVPSGNTGPILNPNNGTQTPSCPLTPYTGTGFTNQHISGTQPIVNAGYGQTGTTIVQTASLIGTAQAFSPALVSQTVWTQLSGPNQVTITNPNQLSTTFTDINNGTYVFQLAVIDSNNNIQTAQVAYVFNIPTNVGPYVDPGGDQKITCPSNSIYLNGGNSSGSTSTISTYQWSQISGPNTADIINPNSSFTQVTGLVPGTYEFSLLVTDDRGCSGSATTLVYVLNIPCQQIPICSQLMYPINGSIINSSTTASLQWDASNCATGYDVYLAVSGNTFNLIGSTSNEYFLASGLTANTIYNWFVVPFNTFGAATGCTGCWFSFVTSTQGSGTLCQRQRWEVYNTATIIGGNLDIYNGCNESCYQYGLMSYWQSKETYPNNPTIWGNLCGQPIRHHKFPDSVISHIHDNQNGSLNYNTNNLVFVKGVKVDQSSVVSAINAAVTAGYITQYDANRIIGFRIVRGNRSGNKSIVAKGLLYDVNYYQRVDGGTQFDQNPIYFSNFPFNDLHPNPFITDNFQNYSQHNTPVGPNLPFIPTNRYTFHSPDTHFNEPTPGTILKLETAEYGQANGYFNVCQNEAKQRFLSDASYDIAFCAGVTAAILSFFPPTPTTYTVNGSVISAMGIAAGEWGPYLPAVAGLGAGAAGAIVANTPTNVGAIGVMSPASEISTTVQGGKLFDYINPVWMAYNIPYLLPLYPLIAANILFQLLTTALSEANTIINLIEAFANYKDWCIQYQAVGKYNAYKPVFNDNGNKIRAIDSSSYLDSTNQFINESSQIQANVNAAIEYNNWNRESSLYLRYTGVPLTDASTYSGVSENSRQLASSSIFGCNLNQNKFTNISSFYASMKNSVPDQYGSIYDIQYLRTSSCMYPIGQSDSICQGVYGGDTFINRFALKIKVPYFLATTLNLPAGTDFGFDLYPNLAIPRFYYDSTEGIGDNFDGLSFSLFTTGAASLLGRPKSIRDCSKDSFFLQNGWIYLYTYGIPYFLVESDYNVDYRYATNNQAGDFYPNQQDFNYWLQQINVPIANDNTYNYNNTYSKQNEETSIAIDQPDFIPGRLCDVTFPTAIIYSDQTDWLVYPPNNIYRYPINFGRVVDIDGLEDQTVIVRLENGMSVFKSILRTVVNGQTVQVGNGGLFANPPQDFGQTKLGYIGTQHKAILDSEYGHVVVDAARGQVFNIGHAGSSIDEISKYGMKNWFKENLPFRLLRQFTNMPDEDIDNSFLGAGITMAFDKRFGRMLLTKKDWLSINSTMTYDASGKTFYVSGNTAINLGDPKYFKDCSWTMSYNFWTKMWVFFHSYKPNYYVEFIEFFGSGVNKPEGQSNWWPHGLYNGSYNVFYGQIFPFIVEPIIKFDQSLKILNSIEFDTEVRRYSNEFDYSVKRNEPGFNKTIIYNDLYNSGLMEMVRKNPNDLSTVGKFPKKGIDKWTVQISQANYKWRVNGLFTLNKSHSDIPLFLYLGNNAEKRLNGSAFNYQIGGYNLSPLKGQWFKTRLINDNKSNYKVVFKLSTNNETTIYR